MRRDPVSRRYGHPPSSIPAYGTMRDRLPLVLILILFTLAACDSAAVEPQPDPEPPPTTGTITGTISLPPGSPGDVVNTRVAIYSSFDDWNNDRFVMQTAANAAGQYTLSNIVPGTYYLDAWKDNDGNGVWSAPDFVGVWGTLSASGTQLTPIPIAAGSTTTISFPIQRFGGPARPEKGAPLVVTVE